MAIIVRLASLAFGKLGEMLRPVHEQRQSRIEAKGEKVTFHLIHIIILTFRCFTR